MVASPVPDPFTVEHLLGRADQVAQLRSQPREQVLADVRDEGR